MLGQFLASLSEFGLFAFSLIVSLSTALLGVCLCHPIVRLGEAARRLWSRLFPPTDPARDYERQQLLSELQALWTDLDGLRRNVESTTGSLKSKTRMLIHALRHSVPGVRRQGRRARKSDGPAVIHPLTEL